eukprot:jgi/Bigna1/81275/fgenesh1_pg.79_\
MAATTIATTTIATTTFCNQFRMPPPESRSRSRSRSQSRRRRRHRRRSDRDQQRRRKRSREDPRFSSSRRRRRRNHEARPADKSRRNTTSRGGFIAFREAATQAEPSEDAQTHSMQGRTPSSSCEKSKFLSEYEKNELQRRSDLRKRIRDKLSKKSTTTSPPSTVDSTLQRMLKSSHDEIKHVASKDASLTKVVFKSLQDDEEDMKNRNYCVSLTELRQKFDRDERYKSMIKEVESEGIESLADKFQPSSTKSQHQDTLVDDAHCDAIFGNPFLTEEKLRGGTGSEDLTGRQGKRTEAKPKPQHTSGKTGKLHLRQHGRFRRAGLGSISDQQISRLQTEEERWAEERERSWKASKNNDDDSDSDSSWGTNGSCDSQKYVDIERRKYTQDLRAEPANNLSSTASKSTSAENAKPAKLSWKERILAKKRKSASMPTTSTKT